MLLPQCSWACSEQEPWQCPRPTTMTQPHAHTPPTDLELRPLSWHQAGAGAAAVAAAAAPPLAPSWQPRPAWVASEAAAAGAWLRSTSGRAGRQRIRAESSAIPLGASNQEPAAPGHQPFPFPRTSWSGCGPREALLRLQFLLQVTQGRRLLLLLQVRRVRCQHRGQVERGQLRAILVGARAASSGRACSRPVGRAWGQQQACMQGQDYAGGSSHYHMPAGQAACNRAQERAGMERSAAALWRPRCPALWNSGKRGEAREEGSGGRRTHPSGRTCCSSSAAFSRWSRQSPRDRGR